jgi:hypothetical protein
MTALLSGCFLELTALVSVGMWKGSIPQQPHRLLSVVILAGLQ